MTLNPFLFDLDNQPVLEFTILKRDNTLYDLTGTTVDLLVEGVGTFPCAVTDDIHGECTRTVVVGDFPLAGRYRAQLRVSGGGPIFHTDIFVVQVSESINTVAVGPVPPNLFPAVGGVLFGATGGQVAQDVSNLFWDVGSNTLKVSVVGVRAGGGTAYARAGGTLNVQTSGLGTDANTSEKVLMTYTLPANSLAVDGQRVKVKARFITAANGNNKTLRLRLGGLAGSTFSESATAAFNARIIELSATLIRKSGTTLDSMALAIPFSLSESIVGPQYSITQTLSNALDIVATGQNGSAVANDIIGLDFEVEWYSN